MRRQALSGCVALALAACATPGPEAYGPFPANYKEIVAEQIRSEFFDPSSLQDVWIAEPYQDRIVFTRGWVVCVRANGKNRFGAYAGRQEYGYLIKNGIVAEEGDQKNCPTARYTRWPEMEMTGSKSRGS